MNLDSWTPRDVARRVGLLVGLTTSSFMAAYLGFELKWNAFLVLGVYVLVTGGVTGLIYLVMRLRYGKDFYGPRDSSPFKDVLEPPVQGSSGKVG